MSRRSTKECRNPRSEFEGGGGRKGHDECRASPRRSRADGFASRISDLGPDSSFGLWTCGLRASPGPGRRPSKRAYGVRWQGPPRAARDTAFPCEGGRTAGAFQRAGVARDGHGAARTDATAQGTRGSDIGDFALRISDWPARPSGHRRPGAPAGWFRRPACRPRPGASEWPARRRLPVGGRGPAAVQDRRAKGRPSVWNGAFWLMGCAVSADWISWALWQGHQASAWRMWR